MLPTLRRVATGPNPKGSLVGMMFRRPDARRDSVVRWVAARQADSATSLSPPELYVVGFLALLMRFGGDVGTTGVTRWSGLCGIECPMTDDRILFELACHQYQELQVILREQYTSLSAEIAATVMSGLLAPFGEAMGPGRAHALFCERTCGYASLDISADRILSGEHCLAELIRANLNGKRGIQAKFPPLKKRGPLYSPRWYNETYMAVINWRIHVRFLLPELTRQYVHLVYGIAGSPNGQGANQ